MDECVFHFDLGNELNNNFILIPIAPLKQKYPLLESIDRWNENISIARAMQGANEPINIAERRHV